MKILKESKDLSKGIFWVKDCDDIDNSFIYFDVPCDVTGNPTAIDALNAKSGKTYNHELTWKTLNRNITDNKPFNYFPRGRVEIAHGKATIYCNPLIATEQLVDVCKNKFNLNTFNGIKSIRLVADGSEHYKCYLDE